MFTAGIIMMSVGCIWILISLHKICRSYDRTIENIRKATEGWKDINKVLKDIRRQIDQEVFDNKF